MEKNVYDKLKDIRLQTRLMSCRGLSLYGTIKSLLPPRMLYVFCQYYNLINDLESGGLNVKDIETLIKASRLAWTGKLFSNGPLPWDAYFNYLLKDFGGEFLFSCNYDVEECKIYSKFCNEFLQWWADFRHSFSTKPPMSKYIIWNNKGIKIDNKSIHYPTDVKAGILFCHHLQFHKDNIQSYYNSRGIGVKKNL